MRKLTDVTKLNSLGWKYEAILEIGVKKFLNGIKLLLKIDELYYSDFLIKGISLIKTQTLKQVKEL
mgnify:FL=1